MFVDHPKLLLATCSCENNGFGWPPWFVVVETVMVVFSDTRRILPIVGALPSYGTSGSISEDVCEGHLGPFQVPCWYRHQQMTLHLRHSLMPYGQRPKGTMKVMVVIPVRCLGEEPPKKKELMEHLQEAYDYEQEDRGVTYGRKSASSFPNIIPAYPNE